MQNFNDFLNAKDTNGASADAIAALKKRIEQILNYEPVVGVIGKTGAGKSSLCNALFGSKIAETSDVEACTRMPQDILIPIGSGKIKLVDFPGVGESAERDEEYRQLYEERIPSLDLLLWTIKSDDRAFSVDQKFFKEVVEPSLGGRLIFIILSQIEKLEPSREWDYEKHLPGSNQSQSIELKVQKVAEEFGLQRDQVIPVSALEEYNLISLVDRIVFSLPKDRKFAFARSVKKEVRSEAAKKDAEAGFFESVGKVVGDIFGEGELGRVIGKKVDKFVRGFIRLFWW